MDVMQELKEKNDAFLDVRVKQMEKRLEGFKSLLDSKNRQIEQLEEAKRAASIHIPIAANEDDT